MDPTDSVQGTHPTVLPHDLYIHSHPFDRFLHYRGEQTEAASTTASICRPSLLCNAWFNSVSTRQDVALDKPVSVRIFSYGHSIVLSIVCRARVLPACSHLHYRNTFLQLLCTQCLQA